MTQDQIVLDFISNIPTNTPEDKKQARLKLVNLQKHIANKLSDTAETDFNFELCNDYIDELLEHYTDLRFKDETPPFLELELESKRQSYTAKPMIKAKVTEALDDGLFCTETELLSQAVKYIKKSNTLAELKSALKLYMTVLQDYEETKFLKEANLYLTRKVDAQDKRIKELYFYQEQCRVLEACLTEDDAELKIAVEAHRLSKQGVSERVIAEQLGVARTKLRRLIDRFKIEDSVQDDLVLQELPTQWTYTKVRNIKMVDASEFEKELGDVSNLDDILPAPDSTAVARLAAKRANKNNTV